MSPKKLAGVEGFEPPDDGIRIRCLTAWRYPCEIYEEWGGWRDSNSRILEPQPRVFGRLTTPTIKNGSGRGIRTLDTTGMNRVLWPTELSRHAFGALQAPLDYITISFYYCQELILRFYSPSSSRYLLNARAASPLFSSPLGTKEPSPETLRTPELKAQLTASLQAGSISLRSGRSVIS